MTGNQHDDNLERFFKQNLERYSPVPSGDFWARMEPTIPPKPSAWRGLAASFKKWAGLGVLLLGGVVVLVLWRQDKQEIERLSKQIANQQAIAEHGNDKAEAVTTIQQLPVKASDEEPINANLETNGDSNSTGQENVGVRASKQARMLASSKVPIRSFGPRAEKSTPPVPLNIGSHNETVSNLPIQVILNQDIENQGLAVEEQVSESVNVAASLEEASALATAENVAKANYLTAIAPMTNAYVVSLKKHVPSVKHHRNKPFGKPYPRISVECGVTTFAMPLSRLFSGDTLYAGRAKPSFAASFLMHYAINHSTAFLGGYQFKDIRTSRISLRYNSFPLIMVQKWNWGRRLTVEGRAGITVNSLLSIRSSTDGQDLRGQRNTWLGWQSGFTVGLPIGEQVTLLAGPTVGSSITSIAHGKWTWEAGLGMNLRYQF